MWKNGVLTNNSLYFENYTRYGHSYNGRPIVSRMWSIDRHHFDWPWTTPSENLRSREDLAAMEKWNKFQHNGNNCLFSILSTNFSFVLHFAAVVFLGIRCVLFYRLCYAIIISDEGGGICFRLHARARLSVCLSVCLCARLLKNACMDLDENVACQQMSGHWQTD